MGGQNSQDSILERRSLVWNDDGEVDRAIFPILGTAALYKGKFYPRGCRGKIEEIQIYRTATAGGTITLRFSPHPCLGPFYQVVIPIGPAGAWTAVAFEEMWNYDSLFVWIHALDAGEQWGYDVALPHDGHESGDLGETWADLNIRPFIRAVYSGETPGDVPVSGMINTIKLPATGGQVASEINVDVQHATITEVVEFFGAGTLIQATFAVQTDNLVLPTNPFAGVYYRMHIRADGEPAVYVGNRDLTQSAVAVAGRSSCGDFVLVLAPDSGAEWMIMNVRLPIEFRRHIHLDFYHTAGAALLTDGYISANLVR